MRCRHSTRDWLLQLRQAAWQLQLLLPVEPRLVLPAPTLQVRGAHRRILGGCLEVLRLWQGTWWPHQLARA